MAPSSAADTYPAPGRDIRVVNATGEIDLETAPALSAALTAAVQHHSWVCCDLSGVTFCCAAGVSVLLEAAHEAARVGHQFHVRGAHGVTARVLHITGAEGSCPTTGARGRPGGREHDRPTGQRPLIPERPETLLRLDRGEWHLPWPGAASQGEPPWIAQS